MDIVILEAVSKEGYFTVQEEMLWMAEKPKGKSISNVMVNL